MSTVCDNIYFDNILIYSEVFYFNDFIKQTEEEKILRDLAKYFKEFGWDFKVINIGNQLKIYFYGKYKKLLNSQINQIKKFKNIQDLDYSLLVDPDKNQMDLTELEGFLGAFSVIYSDYIYKLINKTKISVHKGDNIAKYTPYIWFKGVSIFLKIPKDIWENVEPEIYRRFPDDLFHFEEYDYIDMKNKEKRIKISEIPNNDLLEIEMILRFSPFEHYSLTLCRYLDELPKYELYKGINKIALKMFRYIWAGEYDEADRLLSYEETRAYNKPKTLSKIQVLHRNLEKYREYQRLKALASRLPSKFPSFVKIKRDKEQLKTELEQDDFFKMCTYCQKDFRVFELKVATLKSLLIEYCLSDS